MTFEVLITGKPCAGKTTQARRLAEELRQDGVSVIDVNSRKKSFFPPGHKSEEDDRMKVLVESVLSYASARVGLRRDAEAADVKIVQRLPQDLFVAIASMARRGGLVEGLCNALAEAASRFVKHDLVIYISVPVEALLGRFERRKDNRDSTHRRLIMEDDGRGLQLLSRQLGKDRVLQVNGDAEAAELAREIYSEVIKRVRGRAQA